MSLPRMVLWQSASLSRNSLVVLCAVKAGLRGRIAADAWQHSARLRWTSCMRGAPQTRDAQGVKASLVVAVCPAYCWTCGMCSCNTMPLEHQTDPVPALAPAPGPNSTTTSIPTSTASNSTRHSTPSVLIAHCFWMRPGVSLPCDWQSL